MKIFMKLTVLVIAVMASPLALACPDLTGTYVCKSALNQSSFQISIKTYEENGVVVYDVDGDKTYTDGQSRPLKSIAMEGLYSATCAGNTVDVTLDVNVGVEGQDVSAIKMQMKISQTSVGYERADRGTATIEGQEFPVADDVTCLKN